MVGNFAQPGYVGILAHNRAHFGDRVAITIDDRAMTFAQLADQVEAVRRVLAPHVNSGDRVAIWLPNSFAWIATFLAIVSLRAISVPVNTRLTVAELDVILRDSAARVLVATSRYRGRNYFAEAADSRIACPVVIDASDQAEPADWPVRRAAAAVDPTPPERDDLFCIQYTSGTTSTPKGVMLTEQMYLQTALWCVRCQMLTPESSFMSAAPFFHCSGSMHAITVCLLAGCALHQMSAWDVEFFLRLVRQHRGSVSHGTFLRDIVAFGTDRARPFLETMKVVAATGTQRDLQLIHDELGATGISNLYGMTETCGNFSMWFPDDPLEKRCAANGRPQPGNEIRVADPETGATCAPGRTGEIQMKGHTLTPGYFRRPDANASAFTADGWFRSGDLGAMSDQGELHYIARLKEIVRVGGENVSPMEVEEVVRDVSGAAQVCVLAVPHERLGEVAAAVVITQAEIAWPSVLREMKARLADFKVPRAVYLTDAFPVTGTNKVQRSVLQQQIARGQLTRVA